MRADLSRLPQRAAMMSLQDHGFNLHTLPRNVVAFPGTRSGRPPMFHAANGTTCQSPHRSKRPVAVAGAELNARLMVLLGICVTSAAIALSAVHILQG
jgi:hypothetical protein